LKLCEFKEWGIVNNFLKIYQMWQESPPVLRGFRNIITEYCHLN